jgi:hypothetical protein
MRESKRYEQNKKNSKGEGVRKRGVKFDSYFHVFVVVMLLNRDPGGEVVQSTVCAKSPVNFIIPGQSSFPTRGFWVNFDCNNRKSYKIN